MSEKLGSLKSKLACAIISTGLALSAGAGVAIAAEQPSAEQIIRALKLPKVTRGLTSPADVARAAEEARFLDSERHRGTRSLSTNERDRLTSIAKTKPSIDLEVNFEYNSATIAARAMPQITALGQALTSADLKGATYIVAGHTDARGSDAYNQGLSERRADAVKRFLVDKYGIEMDTLVPTGYGETQLKNASNPFAGDNRRVQIINLGDR